MSVAVRVDSEELYAALRSAGVEEGPARRASQSVVSVAVLDQLVTKGDLGLLKADLELAMAKLSTDLTVRLGALIVATVGVATTVLGFLLTRGGG